ncbi:unnamed protein product [Spirodela intermedia]|uniref:MMS19 nucleotide excision repair protein n=1 Tax=Spirodela intermedia TaxID=51605 RepID=A0A7I8LLF6_SPIIN|nr:unnamed protein product [Spirodela intermedia]
MAKASSWVRHVESFVDSSRSSEQQKASINAIAELVKNDLLTIEGLVRELELYLTTNDSVIRARGILLLAEVLAQLHSKPLHHASIHFLIGFFTSRLADWQALHGALVGCLVLLRRKKDVGMVMGNDARTLAHSCLENVQIQSLALHDRKLCFELFRCLLDMHPEDVATLGEDLVHGICAAIDQEKDPRCLMDAFHIVRNLARLYPEPSGPVGGYASELFEVLSCYFPVHFTHLKVDDTGILREDLSEALMHAFCASPFFEEFAIPLLLDKLSSSLHLAKLDSLKYLGSCILWYGANRMSKHAKKLWFSLKDVIFHFPRNSSILVPKSIEEKDSLSYQIAEEALKCLRAAISQFSNSDDDPFSSLIINDEDIEMSFLSGTEGRSYECMSEESQRKIIAVGSILCELVKASGPCCNRVIKIFFPQLMNMLGITINGSHSPSDMTYNGRLNFGALYLSVELLSSCRDLAVAAQDSSEFILHSEWCSLLQGFSTSLAHSFGLLLQSCSSGDVNEKTRVRDASFLVKGLQILVTFPKNSLQASTASFEDILTIIMSIIVGNFEKSLWKPALEALFQIGLFVGKSHDPEKRRSYEIIVLEKILSLPWVDDSMIPLGLRLEALYSIGSTAVEFMLRVIQELERVIFSSFIKIYVVGEIKDGKTLIQLFDFYSSQVLPWCKRTERFEEVGMRFVQCVWNQIESDADFKIGFGEKDISDALMMTTKLVVSGCRVEKQVLIVQKAYSILLSKKFFPPEQLAFPSVEESLRLMPCLNQLSRKDALFVSLFASVLLALNPKTPIPDTSLILRFLMLYLLKGCSSAAQALGSLLNKWSSHDTTEPTAFILEEAIELILDKGLLEIIDDALKICSVDAGQSSSSDSCLNETQLLTHGLVGLSWIGKGLLMRGHEKAEKVIRLLLKCLLLPDNMKTTSSGENISVESGQDKHILVARSAADAFHVLLCDSEDCLNKKFHATVRPLYQQRFFSAVMPAMLSSIKDCKSQTTRGILYRAFGHIVSDTPLAAVITESRKVVSFILDALSVLSLESQSKEMVYGLLLVLSGIITVENEKEAAMENAPIIISCLIGLISYPHMMLVRETAVQCLMAMSELPHARIYPLRPQVLRAVSRALDDIKRPVRLEAARCRQAWASIASRSLHC